MNQDERKERLEQKRKRRRKRLIRRISIFAVLFAIILVAGVSIYTSIQKKEAKKKEETKETLAPIEIVVEEPEVYQVSILSAGDIILHSPFIDSKIYRNSDGTYDYSSMFDYIKEDYQNSDFTVVNFESTISEGNYSGYPYFRSPAAIADAMKQSHVDLCLLANNHIYDNSDTGLHLTMDYMEQYSLPYTGTRKTTSEPTYLIQEINGIKVGILNYVYETGDAGGGKSLNGNAVSSASGDLINTFHYYDLETFYAEVQNSLLAMEREGVEYTIAYLHWGNEYQTQQSRYQTEMAAKLCELGIDALIGGHPHVIQPVDLLTNSAGDHQMVCVYSLGNHISNQRQELMDSMPSGHTEDGLMVRLTLEKVDGGPVSLIQADFIPTWVYKTLENGGAEYYVFSLEDPEQTIQEASSLNISTDIEKSLNRTNAIIGVGVEKIQNALPITNQ